MYTPLDPGHLAYGGKLLRAHKKKVCSVCGVEFWSVSPNAKACDPCKPELNRRRVARNQKRAYEKKEKAIAGKAA
jgi:hypothetical protein